MEIGVSGPDRSEYGAVGYEARNAVRVVRGDGRPFSPYEMLAGSMSGRFIREAKVRARAGSKPAILSVKIHGSRPPVFRSQLERAAVRLECVQGSKITIKCVGG
ncbi:hypothetical protein IBTHAUMO2_660003 [Nitrosopumilaceae archaeon]|nr:hypothetical protein IBTHAUMO2_660003 [Nitrosopumilaceae archaeon]